MADHPDLDHRQHEDRDATIAATVPPAPGYPHLIHPPKVIGYRITTVAMNVGPGPTRQEPGPSGILWATPEGAEDEARRLMADDRRVTAAQIARLEAFEWVLR